jgi:parvulin-like peptidyl-prolyl isomerase
MPKAAPATPAPVAPIGATSAVVNGVQITTEQVEEELGRLLIEPSIHGGMNADRKGELRAKALDELVVRELAYQDARAKGMVPSPRDVKKLLNDIRGKYHSAADYAEALKAEGLTEDGLRERVERDVLLKDYYRAEVDLKSRVSESEVRRHYKDNLSRFVMPESLHLVAIFVEINPSDEAAAKKKIDEAYADLQKGVNFDAVAYKFSEDEYAVTGGDYHTVHRGQLAPELEALVFGAKENEQVGPVRANGGWYLFHVDSKRAERQVPYKEVRDKLMASLSSRRLAERRTELLDQLRSAATIEYVTAAAPAGDVPGEAPAE